MKRITTLAFAMGLSLMAMNANRSTAVTPCQATCQSNFQQCQTTCSENPCLVSCNTQLQSCLASCPSQ
ncbi:MAG TPA: hypothetical protein VIE43_27120 [Thermoanaerobaculia bacterium]|nr:hypothetical protein [Thermoanaerobaculia bacterium]